MLGRHGVDAGEARKLFDRLLLYFIGHAGLHDLFPQLGGFLRAVLAFAEFLLNGFELFAQIKLALALRQRVLHLRLNLLTEFEQLDLARQLAVDELETRAGVGLLEDGLALDVSEAGQGACDEIGEAADLRNVCRGGGNVVGEIRRGVHDLGEFAKHVLPQSGQFGRDLGFDFRQALDAGAQERLRGGVALDTHARNTFAEEQLPFAHADDLMNDGDRADFVEFGRARQIGTRIDLRENADQPVLTERFHQRHGSGPPHAERQQRVREDNSVADRENSDLFERGRRRFRFRGHGQFNGRSLGLGRWHTFPVSVNCEGLLCRSLTVTVRKPFKRLPDNSRARAENRLFPPDD